MTIFDEKGIDCAMKKLNKTVLLTLFLFLVSLAVYVFQIVKFQAPRETAFYFLQDMAFLPLQVAIVTIVLGKIISNREKRERLKKTNMMAGVFFSEVGNELLELLNKLNTTSKGLEKYLKISDEWSNREFRRASEAIQQYELNILGTPDAMEKLRSLLVEKRYFILLMLENPNLLEHETFTDLLWAIFHFTDELLARQNLNDLTYHDLAHLNNDALRAFKAILVHWIAYMSHLKTDYPYLFSLELRRNPFDEDSKIMLD